MIFCCLHKLFDDEKKWILFLVPERAINWLRIGPLHDWVTWYGINYAGMQIMLWDFQNKGKSCWTGTSSFVLKVPLRYLHPSIIYPIPCDWVLQRAYWILEYDHSIIWLSSKHSNPFVIGSCLHCVAEVLFSWLWHQEETFHSSWNLLGECYQSRRSLVQTKKKKINDQKSFIYGGNKMSMV